MKAYTILAFAALIAAASAADISHLAAYSLTSTDCTAQSNGFAVDFGAVPAFSGAVDVTTGLGHSSYKVSLSACQPINVTACKDPVYVYVEHGLYQACYTTAPTLALNATTNVTTATFAAPTLLKRSLLLDAEEPLALTIDYQCSPTSRVDLDSMGGAIFGSTMSLSFSTDAACASRIVTTAAPTTTAPVATPAPEDKKGLSSWVIVVIIIGAVVAIVAVAVGCWKCRSASKSDSEGVYSQV